MLLKRTTVLVSAVVAAGSAVVGVASPALADPTVEGTYNSVTTQRVVNTTTGVGAPKAALAPGATLTFDPAPALGPQPVSAVDVTVTAIAPTRNGYLTAYAAGTTRPGVATVNFQAGEAAPNDAVVGVGPSGEVTVFNGSAGTVQLAVDLNGYWTGDTDTSTSGGGAVVPVTPTRLADSRTSGTPIASGASRSVLVTGEGGVPAGAAGVVVNVGAAAPTANGYLTATGGATDQTSASRTSTVSFTAARSRSTLAFVPVDPADGSISLYNGAIKSTNFVVDVFAYVTAGTPTDGGSYILSTPDRVADSRSSSSPIPAKGVREVSLFPDDGTSSVFDAVTVFVGATGATSPGYLTAYARDDRGPSSVVNFGARVTRTGTITVPVNADGTISLYNAAASPVSFVVDLQGYVLAAELSGLSDKATAQRIATALRHMRAYAASK